MKNPKDMTEAELNALPGWTEYLKATAVPKKVRCRGFANDDIAYFAGEDGVVYSPTEYDGVWYKL